MNDVVHASGAAASATPASCPDASAPRRFLARLFDMWLAMFALGLLVSLSMMILPAVPLSWLAAPLAAQLLALTFALTLMALVFLLDAAVLVKSGNTPGKALLGLRVVTVDGAALGWGQAARRNLHLWVVGMGLTIPLLNLIAMSVQGWRVAHGRPTSYDDGRYRVLALPLGWGRRIGFAVSLCFMFASVGFLSRMDTPEDHTRTATTWTNPQNGRTIAVAPAWGYMVRNERGIPVELFTLRGGSAMVTVDGESSGGEPLADYTRELAAPLGLKVALRGRTEYYRGVPSWVAEGIASDWQSTRVVVRVIEHEGAFWNVTTLQERPYRETDDAVRQLHDDLWSTVIAP